MSGTDQRRYRYAPSIKPEQAAELARLRDELKVLRERNRAEETTLIRLRDAEIRRLHVEEGADARDLVEPSGVSIAQVHKALRAVRLERWYAEQHHD